MAPRACDGRVEVGAAEVEARASPRRPRPSRRRVAPASAAVVRRARSRSALAAAWPAARRPASVAHRRRLCRLASTLAPAARRACARPCSSAGMHAGVVDHQHVAGPQQRRAGRGRGGPAAARRAARPAAALHRAARRDAARCAPRAARNRRDRPAFGRARSIAADGPGPAPGDAPSVPPTAVASPSLALNSRSSATLWRCCRPWRRCGCCRVLERLSDTAPVRPGRWRRIAGPDLFTCGDRSAPRWRARRAVAGEIVEARRAAGVGAMHPFGRMRGHGAQQRQARRDA